MINKKFLIIVIIILGVGLLTIHSYKNNLNEEIVKYLAEKGYSQNEILKVYTEFGKLPLVSTTVIFQDEVNARYFYRKENGRIYQYSCAPLRGVDPEYKYKHEEKY
ncbi:DUF3139 domain-containing protein [Paenibacillus wynnii]|uniref:DUF3139 domain-containing protein n=1 Tax=Paenibacillus wynnii TaxID=268407 RepID=UPI00069196F3|nr:DUF3139 domain-containing protein [Paenibacillus wynnii]